MLIYKLIVEKEEDNMKSMCLKDLTIKVLEEYNEAMTSEQIWNYAIEKEYNLLVNSNGKTPWLTIASQIYVDIRDNDNSMFIKVGKHPIKFFLKGKKVTIVDKKLIDLKKAKISKEKYCERDLHKILTYYGNNFMHIYTKTIYHEKSKKKEKGANEWLHPDIVGYYFPLKGFSIDVHKIIPIIS